VHAKGRDYTPETIPERETARRLGIEVAIVGDPKSHSTTAIVSRALEAGIPDDRTADPGFPEAKGIALRSARRVLEVNGWLDLRRLVTTSEGAVVERAGNRFVRRIEVAGFPLFVKVARPPERGRSAIQEFQNHLALRAAGIRAPEPWLAAEGRVDGRPVALLLTLEETGLALDEYLAFHWPESSASERHEMALGIGSAVRALHAARFLHSDLSARHLLVEGSAAAGRRAVSFLGLSRLERAGRHLKRRHAAVGLASLARSLRDAVPARFRLQVLQGYLGGSLAGARPWIEAIRARMGRAPDRERRRPEEARA
jgi:hypothetical protein